MNFTQYFIGLTATLSLLTLWFASPLKLTLGKILFKKDLNFLDEFDDILFLKNHFLGKLLSCWICCSFWLSLIVGLILGIPVTAFFSYPCFAYAYYKLFIKKN